MRPMRFQVQGRMHKGGSTVAFYALSNTIWHFGYSASVRTVQLSDELRLTLLTAATCVGCVDILLDQCLVSSLCITAGSMPPACRFSNLFDYLLSVYVTSF